MRSYRVDVQSGPVTFKRDAQGFLVAAARPGRVGVLTYRLPDGSTRKELHDPAEVAKPESLATLAGAPITVRHPGGEGKVTPGNYTQLAKGHMGSDVRMDGDFISAAAHVRDGSTMEACDRGDLVEMSCGYDCFNDPTPGEYNGERYDSVHRDIVYNHVALLPRGGGRAGREVGLRLDAATSFEDPNAYPECMADPIVFKAEDFVSRADHDKVVAERDALKDQLAAEKTARADAEAVVVPAKLDALVKARTSLIESARALGGKSLKTDGLSPVEIQTAAIKAAQPKRDLTNRSAEYIQATFDILVAGASAATQSRTDAAEVILAQRQDTSADVDPVEVARKRAAERNASLYKQTGVS